MWKWLIPAVLTITLLAACSHSRRPYVSSSFVKVASSDGIPVSRVILIGDAGENESSHTPVLRRLSEWASPSRASETWILFLGDNVYDEGIHDGLSDTNRQAAERRLDSQLNAIPDQVRAIFVPGNHDWKKSDSQAGPAALKLQAKRIAAHSSDSELLPQDGCPGPKIRQTAAASIILLDTQWWLLDEDKRRQACDVEIADVYRQLKAELRVPGRVKIVAAHHPLRTYGPHGGFYDWKDYFFPLLHVKKWLWIPVPAGFFLHPVLGVISPLLYPKVISPVISRIWTKNQDTNDSLYEDMIQDLGSRLTDYDNVIFVAGHEHNLQVFEGSGGIRNYIVSGAGSESKINPVGHAPDTLFAYERSGLMVLDFFGEGEGVLLSIVEADPTQPVHRFLLD